MTSYLKYRTYYENGNTFNSTFIFETRKKLIEYVLNTNYIDFFKLSKAYRLEVIDPNYKVGILDITPNSMIIPVFNISYFERFFNSELQFISKFNTYELHYYNNKPITFTDYKEQGLLWTFQEL